MNQTTKPFYNLSILERLIDDNPHFRNDPMQSDRQQARNYIDKIRLNLEYILNTRRYAFRYPTHLTELDCSLVDYGIDDFIGSELAGEEDRLVFCEMIKHVIETYEHRLYDVSVEFDFTQDIQDVLCVKISARINFPNEIDAIVFETHINRKTRFINVNSYLAAH